MPETKTTLKTVLMGMRFRKQETGFIIGTFMGEDGARFTAKGTLSNPQLNMDYELTGEWTEDPRYGMQFNIQSFSTIVPIDTAGIYKYITRICKFVGPASATALIEAHGVETLTVMKNSPETVALIRGITLDKANDISETLKNNEAVEAVTVELESLLNVTGMHKSLAGKIIAIHKHNSAELVKENPYIISSFTGIGFALADRVAIKNKYPRDHINRKKAAAVHVMKEATNNGDVWVTAKILIDGMALLIQVEDLSDGVHALVGEGVLAEHLGGVSMYAFSHADEDESFIARKIAELLR